MGSTEPKFKKTQEGQLTLILQDVADLGIAGILDRAVPNKECIAIAVKRRVDVGQYGLMLGRHNSPSSDTSVPFFDNLFWFGDGIVDAGDWLFVYTGPGEPGSTRANNGVNTIYLMHWGKPQTIFANSMIVPILFRVDAVDILLPPSDQPQLPEPRS